MDSLSTALLDLLELIEHDETRAYQQATIAESGYWNGYHEGGEAAAKKYGTQLLLILTAHDILPTSHPDES